jgi:hypothetical protein
MLEMKMGLQRAKEEGNIIHKIKRRKANWIGHILRRNCLLKHIMELKKEGRINVTGRRGRRCNKLLDDLKENRRY